MGDYSASTLVFELNLLILKGKIRMLLIVAEQGICRTFVIVNDKD